MFAARVGGEELIGLHDEMGEDDQEEIYLVLTEAVRFELADEVLELSREEAVAFAKVPKRGDGDQRERSN